MNIAAVLVGILVLAVAWYVVTTIRIYEALRKRNVSVSFLFLRILVLDYVAQYKQMTLQETGRVGPLFYHWLISINVALAAAILVLLLK